MTPPEFIEFLQSLIAAYDKKMDEAKTASEGNYWLGAAEAVEQILNTTSTGKLPEILNPITPQ